MDKKKIIIICVAAFLIICWIIGMVNPSEKAKAETTPTITEENSPLGVNKEHPFVITASQFAEEINTDIDAAKEKYNGKWVKITGEITDTSDGGVAYGYYIYGQSTITGYRGGENYLLVRYRSL